MSPAGSGGHAGHATLAQPQDPDATDPLGLAEYRPGASAVLTDAERWPTMTPEAAARLEALRRHPLAPAWTHATGDRLTADGILRAQTPLPSTAGSTPTWPSPVSSSLTATTRALSNASTTSRWSRATTSSTTSRRSCPRAPTSTR
ncbi:hypothetical protein [Frondihabitans sp. PAMC 28766]|uniref:hypothetical protein n=1 Tax=Frondihabitans sp. PAMC 28766 TaxID=1795630 RepID=UPI000A99D60C|nr:hypothetical protein [Frondihabitans sp. PAMC 28766]